MPNDRENFTSRIVKYNPATDTVTQLTATLPSGRSFTSAAWNGTSAYVFGGGYCFGKTSCTDLDEIVRFVPATETVTLLADKLPSPRVSTAAAWSAANAFVLGGHTSSNQTIDQIVRYTP